MNWRYRIVEKINYDDIPRFYVERSRFGILWTTLYNWPFYSQADAMKAINRKKLGIKKRVVFAE